MSLAFESIAPGNRFEFDPDSLLDGNHGSCLEYKSRPGRAYLVNGRRIIAVHQHMPTPLAHAHHEQLDLEISGCLPLSENLQDPLLGILVLRRRSLRTFEPADHVLSSRHRNTSGRHALYSLLPPSFDTGGATLFCRRGTSTPLTEPDL